MRTILMVIELSVTIVTVSNMAKWCKKFLSLVEHSGASSSVVEEQSSASGSLEVEQNGISGSVVVEQSEASGSVVVECSRASDAVSIIAEWCKYLCL